MATKFEIMKEQIQGLEMVVREQRQVIDFTYDVLFALEPTIANLAEDCRRYGVSPTRWEEDTIALATLTNDALNQINKLRGF